MTPTGGTVLVTGGAGYIGAHTVKALAEVGCHPIVLDDLSSGHREALLWGEFIEGDVRDTSSLMAAMTAHGVDAVIHCAALIEVGRSVRRPDLFYDVNVGGVRALLDAMRGAGVGKLVFSSTAGVYGHVDSAPCGLLDEDVAKAPASPYGETKLAAERMIAAYCAAFGLSAVALRYFNAAGADPCGRIGEAHDPETHLIPLAVDAGLGRRPPLTVYGIDHATPDGSCVRDYVHVTDIAKAHVAALSICQADGDFEIFNVGTGVGHSVLEVIAAVSGALGRPLPHAIGAARPGDPPSLVADPRRALAKLGWRPAHSSLEEIIHSAVAWRRAPAYGCGVAR